MSKGIAVIWLRNCFRLYDNPPLYHSVQQGYTPYLIYVHPAPHIFQLGAAASWWLHCSLNEFQNRLALQGIPLVIRFGDPVQEIFKFCEEVQAQAVFYDQLYDPAQRQLEENLLKSISIPPYPCCTQFLLNPDKLLNKQKTPYKVFTPFYKNFQWDMMPLQIHDMGSYRQKIALPPHSLSVQELDLLPQHPWYVKLQNYWKPGEIHALKVLDLFMETKAQRYATLRDYPEWQGTSSLSPYLARGDISPHLILHRIQKYCEEYNLTIEVFTPFIRQLIWREFANYILYHFPYTLRMPMNPLFKDFPWEYHNDSFVQWCRGKTGYPIVDAGMRELWETGFMHNRVRMITASFLVKDLFIDWKNGVDWFWDTLVDADPANNVMGWQWVAGCGVDAAPYFRILNPVRQSEKFDPQGVYIKKFLPVLSSVPVQWIHKPWEAEGSLWAKTYPTPLVDHAIARSKALHCYRYLRASK